jgi:hypothetical protein
MESRCGRSDVQRLAVFLVGNGKVHFELGPRFVGGGLAFPGFTIVGKNTGAKNELVVRENRGFAQQLQI